MKQALKRYARRMLAPSQRRGLRNVASLFAGNNLNRLATIQGTDKWGTHWYTQHYDRHFRRLRDEPITLLEIGVGGYDDPDVGGESLRMWKRYFPRAEIYSIDVYDKSPLEEDRIRIFRGSQEDERFLRSVVSETGPIDIVIDDGSHLNAHVIRSFELLFPFVKQGGIYVVEDVQTSYWVDAGGDAENLDNTETSMGYFKRLADGLNHQERPSHEPSYLDRHVVGLHFYHNLVFVDKGVNDEASTLA